MSLFACRYAVVQFLPYAETGEFANVGIVLLCPEKGYFGYRLQNTRRTRRVTQFFERLDRSVYTRAMELFQQELQRVSQFLANDIFPAGNADAARQTFVALTHPREAIVRFAPARAVMAIAPEKALDDLFERYVEHAFATAEHREKVLEKRIGQLLRSLALPHPFQPQTLGDEDTRAHFPFVLVANGHPVKAIKPLALDQEAPHKIFEHADYWLPKIRRLRARGLLPQSTLLTLAGPTPNDEKRYKAYTEIRDEISGLDLQTASANDDKSLRRFALAH